VAYTPITSEKRQQMRDAARKLRDGANDAGKTLNEIRNGSDDSWIADKLGNIVQVVGGVGSTAEGVAAILATDGAGALFGGGAAVVAGVASATSGVAQLLGLTEEIDGKLDNLPEGGGGPSDGGNALEWSQAQIEAVVDGVAGIKNAVGVGGSSLLDIISPVADRLFTFLEADSHAAPAPFPVRATAAELLGGIDAARTEAQAAEVAANHLTSLLKAFFRAVSHYSLDAGGRADFDSDTEDGLITGSGLFVMRQDEQTGESVPALNPYLLTFTSPSDDEVFNLLEVAVDVLNSIPYRRRDVFV